MIDTDKYEGHTEGKWKLHYDDSAVDGDYLDYGAQLDPVGALHPMLIADAQLIADAPLLLEEVKRLRAEHERAVAILRHHQMTSPGAVGVKSSCGIASACRLILNILEGKAE